MVRAELLADYESRTPRRAAFAAPVSLAAHVFGLTLLLAFSVSRVAPPATERDDLHVPLLGPPPVALPPLPKGHAGATHTQRSRAPEPPVLTTPLETTPVEPLPVVPPAPTEDLAPSTGSPLGRDGGSAGGSEAGKEGGQVGGVPWGVSGGAVDGTGELPIPVANPDQPPRLLHRVQPAYPQQAFTQKVEGTVTLEILIDARGRVVREKVIQSIPQLDDAVVAAVRQWLFAPALKNGRPVAALARVPMKFQIY